MAAAWAYFDTGALVKRYVKEPGSAQVVALFRRCRFLSSAIAPVEAMSGLCRRREAGALPAGQFERVVAKMAADRTRWELVGLTSFVLGRAEALIRQQALWPLDAVHLASALIFQEEMGHRLRFVTAQPRQRHVAARINLDVVWVG
jgi:predicted nucleic acid-binding protein